MNEARKRENPALQSQSTAQGDQRFQLQAVSCAGDGAPDFPTIEIYTLPLFFQARPGAIQRIQVLSRVCAKRNSPRGSRGKSSKKERILIGFSLRGDPYGTRTHVTAVKGRCLNHLTNGPCIKGAGERSAPFFGSGTWIRTGDTSGMNRMLWPTELCRHLLPEQQNEFYQSNPEMSTLFFAENENSLLQSENGCAIIYKLSNPEG